MTRPGMAYRLMLRAYPRAFRTAYADEMLRAVDDLQRHGGMSRSRVALHVAGDVIRTAPRMRMESLVTHTKVAIAVALATIIFASALVGLTMLPLLIVALVVLFAVLASRKDRPIVADTGATARWLRWILAGAGSFGIGFVVLAIDGNELTAVGWSLVMASWTLGVVLAVFGVVLGISHLANRRREAVSDA